MYARYCVHLSPACTYTILHRRICTCTCIHDNYAPPAHSRSPGLELLSAERVCDVLNGVTEAVSEVIGGVDAPGVPAMWVGGVLDAVGHRVHLTILHNVLHAESSLCVFVCE